VNKVIPIINNTGIWSYQASQIKKKISIAERIKELTISCRMVCLNSSLTIYLPVKPIFTSDEMLFVSDKIILSISIFNSLINDILVETPLGLTKDQGHGMVFSKIISIAEIQLLVIVSPFQTVPIPFHSDLKGLF